MLFKNETESDITYTVAGVEHTVVPGETVDIPKGIGRKTDLTLQLIM